MHYSSSISRLNSCNTLESEILFQSELKKALEGVKVSPLAVYTNIFQFYSLFYFVL